MIHRRFLLLNRPIVLIAVVLLVILLPKNLLQVGAAAAAATEEGTTCTAADRAGSGECSSSNNNNNNIDVVVDYDDKDDGDGDEATEMVPDEYDIPVINESEYRVDVYWDDGEYGVIMFTLEPPPSSDSEEGGGGESNRNSIRSTSGHSFYVTRHGVREILHDPETDERLWFPATGAVGEEFVIPSNAAPSSDPCQDRFSICESMAANGQCADSPGWMIVHCCRSCDADLNSSKLIDPEVRCSNERLNITEPAWGPGDLNRLFRSWAVEERFQKYSPVVLSSPDPGEFGGKEGPWVMIFDNFFSEAEADAMIQGGLSVGLKRSTDQGAASATGEMEKVVSTGRTSTNAWCIGPCEKLPEVRSLTSRIEDTTGVPETNYESFQILSYGENQFYRMHHDIGPVATDPSGQRIMTFFLYLSDVEEGGETRFNKLDMDVKPKKGRALVWPSVLDDDPEKWDDRMFHEAVPVIKGRKYAANHWIHLNDYRGPNFWGCTGSFD